MYGNLIKTIFVTFFWLSLLLAAPQALAIPKSIADAQNTANSNGTNAVNSWNAKIKQQNDTITSYLNSAEGKGDTTAQGQYQQLSANGGASTSGTTLSTNPNSASTNWNANTGSGTGSGSTISGSATSVAGGSASQRDLLNRQIPKVKVEADKIAMDCATEFTQSVDASTRNNLIGSAPNFSSQYLASGDTLTAAQFCNWMLMQFGLTRQAQVVMAAAAGQPLVPQGQQQNGNPGMAIPQFGYNQQPAYPDGMNQNVGMVLQQQQQAMMRSQQEAALAAQQEARAQQEQQALMYLLMQGLGNSGSGSNGEVDPILMNLLFSGAM